MSRNNAGMEKIKVMDNLYLYEFAGDGIMLPDTITVIARDNQALLIDTAFPEYAERVKIDLEEQGISVKIIILSHYHSDHVSGCPVFSPCDIYASEYYEPNYNNCKVWEPGYTYLRPQHLIKAGDSLSFAGFSLEFIHAPGHSKCSIITKITDKIIHVGDLIMKTKEKKIALPSITDGGDFTEHIASLELIREIAPDIALIPHGGLVESKENIIEDIEERIYYLEKTASSMGTLPLPACLINDISAYGHLEFHDNNLQQLLV